MTGRARQGCCNFLIHNGGKELSTLCIYSLFRAVDPASLGRIWNFQCHYRLEQVHAELGDNLANVQKEAENALDKWKQRLGKIDTIMQTFGASAKADLSHWDGHVGRATLLANRVVSATIRAQALIDVAQRVFTRVGRAITPAKKGKESMKDYIIIETYLASIASLRNAGLTAKVVFVSSNVRGVYWILCKRVFV